MEYRGISNPISTNYKPSLGIIRDGWARWAQVGPSTHGIHGPDLTWFMRSVFSYKNWVAFQPSRNRILSRNPKIGIYLIYLSIHLCFYLKLSLSRHPVILSYLHPNMSSVLMPRFALSTASQGSPHLAHNPNWLLGAMPTPLKIMSQLGWWNSQLNGKIKFMFHTTNQLNDCLFICTWFCWGTQLLSAGKNPHYVAILQAKVQHSVVIFLQNEDNT
jgi:hypothetical protein